MYVFDARLILVVVCKRQDYLISFYGFFFFFSSRRRHTRCALVTGVQTCALPISCRTCSGIQRCSRTTAYIAWHDVGPRNKSGVTASRKSSVLLFIHQLVGADPGHHRAQFAADLFDRMRGGGLAAGLEFGLAGGLVW